MKVIDSHCHLDDKIYNINTPKFLENARENDVVAMLSIGVNLASSKKCIALAAKYPNVYATVGVHPHDAKGWRVGDFNALKELAKAPKVVAIGECGLDFNRMHSPQEVQEQVFLEHLKCAQAMDLPVVLHERDSSGRLLLMLQEFYGSHKAKGVVHCFSGNKDELKGYLALGLHIGITGIITMHGRGEELRQLAPVIPVTKMLVETDAPYLTPTPERNKYKHNEPAFVKTVLLKTAQVCGYELEKFASIIYNNTVELFKLT